MRNPRFLLLIGAILLALWWRGAGPVTHPPGVLIPEAPQQLQVSDLKPWTKDGFLFRPLAEFSMRGRVLLRDRYYLGEQAGLAPVDLTLGWGKYSDTAALSELRLWHSYRYYAWRTNSEDVDPEEVNRSIANMHFIPARESVRKKLVGIGEGELVALKGYLVEIARADGFIWKSSLTREDSGDGACEVVWLEEIQRVSR